LMAQLTCLLYRGCKYTCIYNLYLYILKCRLLYTGVLGLQALGAQSSILSRATGKYRVSVVIDRCKECGICIFVCPTKVLVKSSVLNKYGYHPPDPVNIDKCIGCRLCEYNCPDFAIYVEKVV
jgi:2-oxoglutarate ferredoxin oxidoreductase subunit delta